MRQKITVGELLVAAGAFLAATLLTDSEALELVLLAVAFIFVAAWLVSTLGILAGRTSKAIRASVVVLASGGFSLIRKPADEPRLAKAYGAVQPQGRARRLIVALSSGGFDLARPARNMKGPERSTPADGGPSAG
jgi:hypothetical protein